MADVEGVGAFSEDNMTLLWLPQQHAVRNAYVCMYALSEEAGKYMEVHRGRQETCTESDSL